MRDYWLTKDLLQATGIAFIVLSLVGIGLALALPKKWWGKLLAVIAVACVIAVPVREARRERQQQRVAVDDYKERYAKAKAQFDERCKTAGEKIHLAVEDVDGISILTMRSSDRVANEGNPAWAEAGLPNEATGDGYVETFLLWEQHQDKRNPRGYLNTASSGLPGYRHVDVKAQGDAYTRYRLDTADPDRPKLLKQPLVGEPSRYAVSFKNITDAKDRDHWVAGTTVQVTDTQTQRVLAEATWYSFEPGLGSTAGSRQPWRFAITCPASGSGSSPTRFFVDQVLKPKRGM